MTALSVEIQCRLFLYKAGDYTMKNCKSNIMASCILVKFSLLLSLGLATQAYKVRPGVLSTAVEEAVSDKVRSCSKTKVVVQHDHIDHAWDIDGVRSYAQLAGWQGLIRSGISVNTTFKLGDFPGTWSLELNCRPRYKGLKLSLNYTTDEAIPYQIHGNLALVSENSSVVAKPYYLFILNRTFSDYSSQSRLFFDHAMKRDENNGNSEAVTYYNAWIIFEHELEELSTGENAHDDTLTVTFSVDITHAQVLEDNTENSNECSQPNFQKAKEFEVPKMRVFSPLDFAARK